MDSIVKWEYKTIRQTPSYEKLLTELGQQGWEAFACTDGEIIMKRPCGEIAITKHISQERNQTDYDGYER